MQFHYKRKRSRIKLWQKCVDNA